MNRGLLQVLFCALLLTLTSSPAWGICRPENRVGGSPVFSSDFASQESAKPIGTPSENPGYGYDFASGVHKYLYCQGNPVNNADPSGKSVYVCTRPLNIKGHENDGNNACHVFLAFDSDGMNNVKAWEDAVTESWDAAKHPNTYGIEYYGDPDNLTFSFHPKSVLTGDESEEYGGPLLTPGSYVADQAGIDQRAVNKTGTGYNKWMVAKGNDIQMAIFKGAVRSRDKNNNGIPDPMPYEFSVFNCGSWVQYIIGQNGGVTFPDKTINHGVGLLSSGANGYTAAGYTANAAARTWRAVGLPSFTFPDFSGFFDGL